MEFIENAFPSIDSSFVHHAILRTSSFFFANLGGGHRFPNFEMLDAKVASALKKNHHEFPLQDETQTGGA